MRLVLVNLLHFIGELVRSTCYVLVEVAPVPVSEVAPLQREPDLKPRAKRGSRHVDLLLPTTYDERGRLSGCRAVWRTGARANGEAKTLDCRVPRQLIGDHAGAGISELI